MSPKHRHKTYALYACFFLSGITALIYELLWVREMSLFLGHSQWAVSVVIAAFMSGLAIGGWGGGRVVDAVPGRRLPELYALLEAGIAVYGLCFLPLTAIAQKAALASGVTAGPLWLQASAWFIAGFMLLLIPTALMGATFPVFVRWLATYETRDAGPGNTWQAAGMVYWLNTGGAVCGTLAAGFFMIERLGLRWSFVTAAAVNVLCAVLALAISRGTYGSERDKGLDEARDELSAPTVMTRGQMIACALLFLSGYAAMITQMAWIRSLALVIGSSTYAFTAILCVFLLGLSSGGGAAGLFFKRSRPGWESAAAASLGAMVCIFISLSLQNTLPFLLTRLYTLYFNTGLPLTAIHLLMAGVSIFPAAVCMGFLYPALMGAGHPEATAKGRTIGRYAAVNTAGSVSGSLAAGFALIPLLGMERTLVLAGLLYLLTSLAALSLSRTVKRHIWLITAPALAAVALLIYPKWDPWILSSGAFLYTGKFHGVKSIGEFRARFRRDASRMLMHRDGAVSTVSVFENSAGQRFLRVNGKSDASNNRPDMATQLLLAYIPRALFEGEPKNALIVGLGSGASAGALTVMPELRQVDCVEIEPEVARAATFFSAMNRGVLKRYKFNLIFTDARHLLTGPGTTYDLIISEPSNPWMAGVASLYTQEAFSLVKARLSRSGIFCQWLHGYSMSERDFRMVLNTFASVFPHMMLFSSAGNDYLIIGSQRRIAPDYARIRDLLISHPDMGLDLLQLGLGHPFAFLASTFVFDDAAARAYAAGAPVHTDDRMTLEFSAPRSLLKMSGSPVSPGLARARTKILPDSFTSFSPTTAQFRELCLIAGEAALGGPGALIAEPLFRKVLEISPGNPQALSGLGRAAAIAGNVQLAETFLKEAVSQKDPRPASYLVLGSFYAARGRAKEAIEVLRKGSDRYPSDPDLALSLAEAYYRGTRYQEARRTLKLISGQAYKDTPQGRAAIRLLGYIGEKAI